MTEAPTLKRGIRFRDLTLFYVATTFSLRWTATAAASGPSSLFIWECRTAGLLRSLAASVMELSSRHPEQGGLYVWTQIAFGDGPGFVAAWVYWMSNQPYYPAILYFGGATALLAFDTHSRVLSASPMYYILFATCILVLVTRQYSRHQRRQIGKRCCMSRRDFHLDLHDRARRDLIFPLRIIGESHSPGVAQHLFSQVWHSPHPGCV